MGIERIGLLSFCPYMVQAVNPIAPVDCQMSEEMSQSQDALSLTLVVNSIKFEIAFQRSTSCRIDPQAQRIGALVQNE